MINQGEIWWAELPEARGSEPGYRRPVVVVQGDAFNRSRIQTVVCVAISSNLRLAEAPGNIFLGTDETNLSKDSVANVSQVITLDRHYLTEKVHFLPKNLLDMILDGIMLVIGR